MRCTRLSRIADYESSLREKNDEFKILNNAIGFSKISRYFGKNKKAYTGCFKFTLDELKQKIDEYCYEFDKEEDEVYVNELADYLAPQRAKPTSPQDAPKKKHTPAKIEEKIIINDWSKFSFHLSKDKNTIKIFKNGEDYLRQGRHYQALSSFLKVVDSTPIAPESHLYLGQLYLERTKDPVLAIYHFREYLKYSPASRQAPMVRELINTAKKEFARTFPANLFDAQLERMDMLDVIEQKAGGQDQ
ncbi:MAG: tetratricopeptide repeat protein [Deltaproteobacteria bacterium]|nr:tetratricopeptide repeat protein [Deltaproteobacteria bacterium]